jgi:hypothetical protein
VNLRLIDWIWHVRGSVALAPGQSSEDAFNRLEPLFDQTGTHHQRTKDLLRFSKKDPAAQDKMSVFDGGALCIDKGMATPVLRYHLTSRALLFCFLAPLLFLGIAQLTLVITKFDKPAQKAAHVPAETPMNPIDIALGAPAPERKKANEADTEGGGKKPSPTAAYIFAGIFAVLYVVGRILEDRLVKALFRKRLRKDEQ